MFDRVKLADLREDPRNARQHGEANLSAIRASLQRFGQVEPLVVRAGTREVIGGNGRLSVMRSLGWEEADIREIELSDAEAIALGIALNRTAELATWNDSVLREHLRSLAEGAFELELGFEGFDFDIDPAELEPATTTVSEHERALAAPPEESSDDMVPEVSEEPLPELGETYEIGRHSVRVGDCLELLRGLPEASADSIVTDPPYGLGYMGAAWDQSVPGAEFAEECLRVLKPGGYIVAFGSTRTVHRIASALEDAGFEIRDSISWLTYNGFPKSLDLSKEIDRKAGARRPTVGVRTGDDITGKKLSAANGNGRNAKSIPKTVPATELAKKWSGWGTGLKPAIEPAVLARKPPNGTVLDSVLEYGTGALNLGGCRYPLGDPAWPGPGGEVADAYGTGEPPDSRWPANVYYCPKPSVAEKEEGTEELPRHTAGELTGGRKEGSAGLSSPRSGAGRLSAGRANAHPTVKPIGLMRWIVRLVTPPGGTVIEPFLGSGTTAIASEREGFRSISSELSPEYARIALARIRAAVGVESEQDKPADRLATRRRGKRKTDLEA